MGGLLLIGLFYLIASIGELNTKETEGVLWSVANPKDYNEIVKSLKSSSCKVKAFDDTWRDTDKNFQDLLSLEPAIKATDPEKDMFEITFKFYKSKQEKIFVYYYTPRKFLTSRSTEYLESKIGSANKLLLDCFKIETSNANRINL